MNAFKRLEIKFGPHVRGFLEIIYRDSEYLGKMRPHIFFQHLGKFCLKECGICIRTEQNLSLKILADPTRISAFRYGFQGKQNIEMKMGVIRNFIKDSCYLVVLTVIQI